MVETPPALGEMISAVAGTITAVLTVSTFSCVLATAEGGVRPSTAAVFIALIALVAFALTACSSHDKPKPGPSSASTSPPRKWSR